MHSVTLCILLLFEERVPCTGCKLVQIVKCKAAQTFGLFVCNIALFIAASEFTRTCLIYSVQEEDGDITTEEIIKG